MVEALRVFLFGNNSRAVRKQVERVYSYICVDKFQDTNRSQYDILTRLGKHRKQRTCLWSLMMTRLSINGTGQVQNALKL